MKGFWAGSMYGMQSRRPIVQLRYQDFELQVSPEEARAIAQSIIEAAEAAEQDAFLFEWVKEEMAVDDGSAAGLLREYRAWRDKKRSEPDGL